MNLKKLITTLTVVALLPIFANAEINTNIAELSCRARFAHGYLGELASNANVILFTIRSVRGPRTVGANFQRLLAS